MSKSKSAILVEKSINALISSIEIYNKPDFKYREENFCILIINAWELLFKARILKDNKNNLSVLYIKEFLNKKDGTKGKQWKYKLSRSGNLMTKELTSCISMVASVDPKLKSNIETLIELRDNSTHFYNSSIDFIKIVHEIGSASVYDFVYCLKEWFGVTLNKYNLYLLPLSFFISDSIETIPIYEDEKRLIKYIEDKKANFPYVKSNALHYAFQVEITLTKKSKGTTGLYLTNDPSATAVKISDEDLEKKYPFDYKSLTALCTKRYKNFSINQKYHNLRAKYANNAKYCYERYLSLDKKGTAKKYYSNTILEAFDKVYTKK